MNAADLQRELTLVERENRELQRQLAEVQEQLAVVEGQLDASLALAGAAQDPVEPIEGEDPAESVFFTFFGTPRGKKTSRSKHGQKQNYSPDDQQFSYAGIAGSFQVCAPQFWVPWPCGVTMEIAVYLRQPSTWEEGFQCLKKPDWDNVGKLVGDSLNGVAYLDDAQIFDGRVQKAWTNGMERTCVRLQFWPAPARQMFAQAALKAAVKAHRSGPWVERWVSEPTLDLFRSRISKQVWA